MTPSSPAAVAIVGAGGVLGSTLVGQALAQTDARIYAFTHGVTPAVPAATATRVAWQALDLADADAVDSAVRQARPSVVINSAAMTNVDACETRRDEAWQANAAGPRHLAAACVRQSAHLIHVSTDYVFPGDEAAPGPYTEDAAVRPVNYYGWTKLEGERAVEATCAGRVPWLVVRTALVYGYVPGGRANFVTWLVGELRAGRRVRVVADQINTPTLADDLAGVLLRLAQGGSEGMIHVAGPDWLSRDAWAHEIAAHYSLDTALIETTTTAELRQPAPRPLRGGLRSRRSAEWGDVPLRGVEAGLAALSVT